MLRRLDDGVKRREAVERALEPLRPRQPPERGKRPVVLNREIDVELDETARVQPPGVDYSKMRAVEEQTPGCRAPDRERHRRPPERIEALTPRRDEKRHVLRPAARAGRREHRIGLLDVRRWIESKRFDERRRGGVEHRAHAGGRTERVTAVAPVSETASHP